MRMSFYFLECSIRGLSVALDARVFTVIYFMMPHINCNAFYVCPVYGGYMSHTKSKFEYWCNLFVLAKKDNFWGLNNIWSEGCKFSIVLDRFSKVKREFPSFSRESLKNY